MKRRGSVFSIAAIAAMPRIVAAQARKVRIGVLVGRRNSTFLPPALKRLAELGYVEGRNLVVDNRSADGVAERFPPLARELIETRWDLIFAIGTELAARALIDAKSPIPVVFIANDYDPIKAGIASSLRRPGGNITGVVLSQIEVAAKRMEIMREILPKAARYLVLSDVFTKDQLEATQLAARQLGVGVVPEIFGAPPYDVEAAFAKHRARVDALMVLTSPQLFDLRARVAESATKHRLPASVGFPVKSWGEAGFLLSYTADQDKLSARAGDIAARILKDANPAEIPVEQPTTYEMVINLKTARALNIRMPQSVLVRADRVIE